MSNQIQDTTKHAQDAFSISLPTDEQLAEKLREQTQAEEKVSVKQKLAAPAPSALGDNKGQSVSVEEMLIARINEMENELQKIKNGKVAGISAGAARSKKIIDFSKLTEADVFDLSTPIETVSNALPDTAIIKLKDPTYIPRWVSKKPDILGMRKAMGFTYITTEDLDGDLGLSIELDENGHYSYHDIVAMKCPKVKYFGMLREKHIRAANAVKFQNAAQEGARMIQAELEVSDFGNIPGDKSRSSDYGNYQRQGKMNVYTPGI